MGRMLRWTLGLGLAVIVLALALVNVLAEPGAGLPPPDPSTLISLPNGERLRLDELLAGAPDVESGDETATASAPAEPPDDGDIKLIEPARPDSAGDKPRRVYVRESWRTDPDPSDPYELAEYHLWETREIEQAYALFRSVPADHPHYNVAQRRIGWEILTRERGEPRLGVAYINRSMAADPFDHDIWQDTWRVYTRTLGLETP